jgi:hypothetical protein
MRGTDQKIEAGARTGVSGRTRGRVVGRYGCSSRPQLIVEKNHDSIKSYSAYCSLAIRKQERYGKRYSSRSSILDI